MTHHTRKLIWSLGACSSVALLVSLVIASRNVICIDGLSPPWLDDTIYAPKYSDGRFCQMQIGTTAQAVMAALGPPLAMEWRYETSNPAERVEFGLTSKGLLAVSGGFCGGMTPSEVKNRVGQPDFELWKYSDRGPSDGFYRVRVLHLARGFVVRKIGKYYYD